MLQKSLIIALSIMLILGVFTSVHAQEKIPISLLPYTITEPGVYYLTEDLVLPLRIDRSDNGIIVATHNVVIDLMGHSISSPYINSPFPTFFKPSLYGIKILGSNIEIKNGTVNHFGYGGIIWEAPLIPPYGGSETNTRIIDVNCCNNGWANGGPGIDLPPNSMVKNCIVESNYGTGISITYNSIVRGNNVYNNNRNNDTNCAGIKLVNDCLIKDNMLDRNKQSNIHVIDNGNAIEENLLLNSDHGIYFESGGNFYANNRASKCTTNYANTNGNTDGGRNASY